MWKVHHKRRDCHLGVGDMDWPLTGAVGLYKCAARRNLKGIIVNQALNIELAMNTK